MSCEVTCNYYYLFISIFKEHAEDRWEASGSWASSDSVLFLLTEITNIYVEIGNSLTLIFYFPDFNMGAWLLTKLPTGF